MLWSVLGLIFFVLLGLGSAWVGIYVVQRKHVSYMSVTVRWLLRSGFMAMGLGWVAFGLTAARYYNGRYMRVPASAPLMDHVIRIIAIVGLLGAAVLFSAAFLVGSTQQDRMYQHYRTYYEDDGDS